MAVSGSDDLDVATRWDMASESTVPRGRPVRELVVTEVDSLFRWHRHDFPHPLARWHAHPEVEIHLITAGRGSAFVGDYVGRFSAGHVVAVGSELPHNWISEVAPGEVVGGRDVVLQLHPDRFRRLSESAPEAREAVAFFDSIRRGVEYSGATARSAAELLMELGEASGLARLSRLFQLLEILHDAPESARTTLSREAATGGVERSRQDRVDAVLTYITDHLHADISLSEAARVVSMSPSSLSRFFRLATGRGFAETVRRVRILRAIEMLRASDTSVLGISQRVGYNNISNFNRQFLRETGQTPTAFRAAMAKREPPAPGVSRR